MPWRDNAETILWSYYAGMKQELLLPNYGEVTFR